MKYKNAAVLEIKNIVKEFEEYTLGQVLLSIIQQKPEGVHLKEWLRDVSNEDLYTTIEGVKFKERY